jgi:hypothetical protein
MMNQRVRPFLMFQGKAEEAMRACGVGRWIWTGAPRRITNPDHVEIVSTFRDRAGRGQVDRLEERTIETTAYP